MKRLSDLLHHTPWWLLLVCGLATALALVVFATPFQIIRLEHAASTPEQKRAIKREIDLAFSEGLVDVAGTVLREMRDRARDPARQKELDAALEDIETARESLREAGAEAQRAKREASQGVADAIREAHDAIEQAHREASSAMKDEPERERVEKSLQDSLKAAEEAAQEAKKAGTPTPPRIVIKRDDGSKPLVELQVDTPATAAPLPPDVKRDIRRKLTTDLWRIGVGTGLLLILLPLFILAVVSKFFIDRSRASQKVAEAKKREAEYHRMSRQVTEAKLAALQAQVEPHFLYNTLASVQALTEVDPRKANEMTGHLIQYLRNALPKMRESVSTVGQEVELVRAYLNILQMRMGKRLAFDIDVAPGLEEASFPPLMLPSLVENAIKHGLEPLREGGRVSLAVTEVEGRLRASVADTGRGFGETLGAGVGLANIRERLAALYGGAGTLTLEANAPQGVIATIEIPRKAPSAEAVQASLAASSAPAAASQPARTSAPPPNGGAPAADPAPPMSPMPPPTRAQRVLSGLGAAERAWRKGLTYTFMVLVGVAGVLALIAALGVLTGTLHMKMGEQMMGNAAGAFLGTAGIAIAFVVAVIALAIVVAVIYGLGFLLIAVLVVLIASVLIAIFPVLAPFILLALLIGWLVRRVNRRGATLESSDAHRHPG
jgi:two-component sensor histidine kinase